MCIRVFLMVEFRQPTEKQKIYIVNNVFIWTSFLNLGLGGYIFLKVQSCVCQYVNFYSKLTLIYRNLVEKWAKGGNG